MTAISGDRSLPAPAGDRGAAQPIWPILAAACFIFLLLRIQTASIALERDEGEYAYIAQRMLAGDVPYRDVFDQKPPGVFLAYLAPVAMFGTSVRAIHWAMFAWSALTAWALFGVGREVANRAAAAWAVLVFAVITIEPSWLATAANTEQFMLLPLVLSVWFVLRGCRSEHLWWWIGAGVAAMTACWFKQVAITNIAFLVLLAEWRWRTPGVVRVRRMRAGVAFAGGMIAAAAPVVGYFALRGALGPFVDCVWRHNVTYATSVRFSVGIQLLRMSLERQAGGLWPVWLLSAATLVDWRRAARSEAAVCLAWFLASAAGVSIGFYFRDHYFIQLAPPLALAAGIACARLTAIPARPSMRMGLGLAAGLLVAGAPLITHRRFFFATSGKEQSLELYGMSPFALNDELAAVIRAQTKPDDRVLIFGSEPQLLFQAERRSATRYILFYPLMMGLPRELDRQHEAFAEISANPPQCVVWTNVQTSLLMQPETNRFLHDAVGGMLVKDYRIVAARLIDGGVMRFLTDPGEATAAWNTAPRSGGAMIVDMVVLVRK